jgi:amino acid transporter
MPQQPPIDAAKPSIPTTRIKRIRNFLVGPPKDPTNKEVFHQLSLVAFLAWVGLGADGLSSSAYGPAEAFKALLEKGDHTYLAILLAAAMAFTVFIISYAYSRIIEHFPYGGGGYVVATQLLGPKAGVVSGCALLVDYVLTISVSVASGADALWSVLPDSWANLHMPFTHAAINTQDVKIIFEVAVIFGLVVINLRGVKESVTSLVPIFMVFVVTHVIFIIWAVAANATHASEIGHSFTTGIASGTSKLGVFGLMLLFARAYSLGGGTYTGIEAVSNGIGIMREPKVQTAKRTMVYMATSLAFTAGGILLCYLLVGARPVLSLDLKDGVKVPGLTLKDGKVEGKLVFGFDRTEAHEGKTIEVSYLKLETPQGVFDFSRDDIKENGIDEKQTMNAVLAESVAGSWQVGPVPVGKWFVFITLISETFLLFVAAQAGFIDGPRVMANMALDSWFPHRFASLSDRLTTANGVLLMGVSAALALVWVRGSVSALVVMYSINVFLTFSLSELGMCKFWITGSDPSWKRHLPVHLTGLCLCLTILCVTTSEKFSEGGWLTIIVTSIVIVSCFLVKGHYSAVADRLRLLNKELASGLIPETMPEPLPLIPDKPTAVVLVSSFSGIGIHTCLNIFKYFPGHFKNIVFASAAIIDSGNFKGSRHVSLVQARTEEMLKKYVAFATSQGMPATYTYSVGTEPVEGAEALCQEAAKNYTKCMFFAGQLVFEDERWYHRLLHNNTAYAIQKRLQWDGLPMIILPVRVRGH